MNKKKTYLKNNLWTLPFWALLCLYIFAAIYAPFLASSKPLIVNYDGEWLFPLFRYLFYKEFFSKPIDLFFNLLMFTLPAYLILLKPLNRKKALLYFFILQFGIYGFILFDGVKDPSSNLKLAEEKKTYLRENKGHLSWEKEVPLLNVYERFNLIWQHHLSIKREKALRPHLPTEANTPLTILKKQHLNQIDHASSQEHRDYLLQRQSWIQDQSQKINFYLMPFLRPFHWEENTLQGQELNPKLPWDERTRINRKDLGAALIFGARISMVVGILSIGLALLIGIPIGAVCGYFGGKVDLLISRLLEIWESFPTFFMLLFITAILQSKSILLVIIVLGLFSWTGFARFIRAEVLKQKGLPYIEACQAFGLSSKRILFSQILPNAISPIITLLPFAIMGAISSEAGLSFLGLGEEGSCSWGTLMDEGRISFPAESYLLWPPAIALSLLLISVAIIGDSLRDWLDPKLKG